MEGVPVSAKAEGSTITTSVYTDADGNFYFPRMADGQYQVWAQAKGFERAHSPVNLSGSVQHQNFTLKTMEDFSKQMSGDEWMASMPEDTKEDRRMKEVLRLNCVGCHSPAYPLQNRFDEKGWEAILTLMSKKISEGTADPIFVFRKHVQLSSNGTDVHLKLPRLPLPRGRYYVWFAAVDHTLAHLYEVNTPTSVTSRLRQEPIVTDDAPDFVKRVEGMMLANKGDLLPVSAFPVDGSWPLGTARYEKRIPDVLASM